MFLLCWALHLGQVRLFFLVNTLGIFVILVVVGV